ncbi:MAG: hypothetical protein M3Y08_10235 [Fibrobacterota bacterium]|nr:hypothetical protein [Fibrobacterota bacterium]
MTPLNRLAALGFCLCLGACGEWKMDSSELTARSSTPVMGPDCASCHGYPLKDLNHEYHLEKTAGNRDLNGKISCMDCHSQSIRFREVVLLDSVYEEASGEQYRTLIFPNPNDTSSDGNVIRRLLLLEVDTLPQHQPVPAPDRPGAKPRFQEYITALAHMNEKVDVVFDSRNSMPGRFAGQQASYNPTQETCSAVACHPGDKPYSFGSVSKGLPILKDDREEP